MLPEHHKPTGTFSSHPNFQQPFQQQGPQFHTATLAGGLLKAPEIYLHPQLSDPELLLRVTRH